MQKSLIILFIIINYPLFSQTGSIAYNIVNDPGKVAFDIRGIANTKIYNNTIYSARTPQEAPGGLVNIYTNNDKVPGVPSQGTKIFNNIFYSRHQIINININDNGCMQGFESDYNIFYCEDGPPLFEINNVKKTFAQWQALGYDSHSAVLNPNFINTTDFVPGTHLNYGTDLGSTWQTGLSTNATWDTTVPETTNQIGIWQVGARIYTSSTTIPVYTSSAVENATPSRLEITYNFNLANVIPAASAFTVRVNSVSRLVNSVAISGTKVLLTLANPIVNGNVITVAYTKPSTNPLQTATGGQAATISAQAVTNKVSPVNPVYVSSSVENSTPSVLKMIYNLSFANVVPPASAFTVMVNSVARPVNSVAIAGTNVLLTLATPVVNGNVITVGYTKPSTNPLQSTSGGLAASVFSQIVVNNCLNAAPVAVITSPVNNSSFTSLANITITANASDADGSITLVEFYNGSNRIGSKSAAPYSFVWNGVGAGDYSLTVKATDNQNAKTTSSAILISVDDGTVNLNLPPVVIISAPEKNDTYENSTTIDVEVAASDPDGTISKVELYNGSLKLVELTSSPYSYTWKDVKPGTYIIKAIATDNLNATTTSSTIEFSVGDVHVYDANSEMLNLFPNPNNGQFSIEVVNPLQNEKYEIIITDLNGKQIYHGSILEEETIRHFDLSYIKSGVYILMMMDKEILITKKFIKK